tara:strand:- start:2141 stop:2350 length:210 start_codon:yes stop_codon:yes gene_type:complete
MKAGDLIRVQYRDFGLGTLTEPLHGIIYETPDMGPQCVWKMWCIERGQTHIISPSKDKIEVINEANIGD